MDPLLEQLIYVVIIATSVWVAYDANKLMSGVPKPALRTVTRATTSPAVWCIACLLVWIVAFPWYLAVRGKYKALHGR